MKISYFSALILLLSLVACSEEATVPKPRAYPKIEYPQKVTYSAFDTNFCAFTFEQPSYMTISQDTTSNNKNKKNLCWFNLEAPVFNATIHFTYEPVKNRDEVYHFFDDAYRMASLHDKKADFNNDYNFSNPAAKVYGVLFDIEGNVASEFQFAVTDSTHHALRASLYFNARPNQDSLKPMAEFVKADMMKMLNTLKWKS